MNKITKINVYDLDIVNKIMQEMNATPDETKKVYWPGITPASNVKYNLFGKNITIQTVKGDREHLWEDMKRMHNLGKRETPETFKIFQERCYKEALIASMTPEELEKHKE